MKNKLLLVAGGLFIFQAGAFAQSVLTQNKVASPKSTAMPTGPADLTKVISTPHELCGIMQYTKWLAANDPTYMSELEKAAKIVADYAKAHASQTERTTGLITLPVVVHVVYNSSIDPNEKITTAAVNSQIAVLNADFTRTNADASTTPSAFTPVAVSMGVNFCLATKDPSNNPTTGIVYTSTASTGFITDNKVKFTSSGGDNQWNPNKYLNIWVCDLATMSGGVLGYGEFPTSTLSNTFGVVCDYRCFGTTGGYLFTGYTGGRTMTHEFSHCFNLHHTWGDDGGVCPWQTGGADDGAADTPPEGNSNNDGFGNGSGPTFNCPTFPYKDNCSTTSPGIMFMNFMNYTSDNCKNTFTNDQKTTVINTLNTLLAGLLSSNVCSATATPVADFKASATTVPQWAYVNFTDLSSQYPTAWSWNFTSALTPTSTVQNPTNIQWSAIGKYTCSLKATNGFGNNTATKTNYINVIAGQACDTVTNLHATDTLTYYQSQNTSAVMNGYVLGNNGYNVCQKVAEYFSSYPSPGFTVTGVYVYFAKAYSKTKSVTITLWDNSGAGGSPNLVLGSKTVAINTLSTTKPTYIAFTSPITVGSTGFYAGVDYTTIETTWPTDSLAIVSNISGESVPGTTWQYFNNGSGNVWDQIYNIWGISISSAIYPVMCTSPTDLAQYDLSSGIKLYPNPSTGRVTAELSLEYTSNVQVEVFNTLGQNVQQMHWDNVSNGTYHIDLSNQPNGMYFIKLISDHATITKKIMIER
jgi:PKD repeat protein